MQTVRLSELKPGHEYPGISVNARTTDRKDGHDALVASIKADGLLQSLLVCPAPDDGKGYFVIAGNRRLAALKACVKDMDVPVIIRSDVTPGSALALSVAENITQVPLHPVDRYEAFAAIIEGGKTEADIATTYCINERTVKQALALGRLAPAVREAWRKGKITADTAGAFTLGKDHEQQESVFKKLAKGGGLHTYNIRQHLVGNQQGTARLLKFVGRAAYEKAGGKVQEDLFSNRDDGKLVVSDYPLLKRLAGERIEAECAALKADGWGWAENDDSLPNEAGYMWKRLPGGKNAPKAERAKAGCAVGEDWDGKLKITYGLIKPSGKNAATSRGAVPTTATDKTAKPKSPNVLSNSLKQDLDAMAARAAKDALLADSYGDELAILLAKIVATQITPERYNYMPSVVRESLDKIQNGITPKVMAEALKKRFDTQRYFAGAPKNLVLKAIAEAVSAEQSKKLATGTKAAAWKFALANVPKTGWLPPELRTAHYDGPGAKAKKAAPAKQQRKLRKAA